MRKKILIRLSLLTAILTILWSCRSEDFIQSEKNPQRSNKDFFKHSENGGSTARTGVDYIDLLEAYNREIDFTSHIPDRNGMPVWEKMKIVRGEKTTSLMIPLSVDDYTMSSILFALIDNDANRINDVNNITNEELQNVVYGSSYSKEEKENLFTTFMVMDNYTFGIEAFTNIPKDLFAGYKMGALDNQINFHAPYVKETGIKEQTDASGRLQVVQEYVCAIVRHCTKHGPGPCDGCSLCQTQSCSHSTVFIYSYPDPETGIVTYGYPDEGGGPGLPAVIPGPDPCGLSKAFYRLAPNCNGNEPVTPPKNPCETLKEVAQQNKVKDSIDFIKTKTTGKQEFAIEVYHEDTGLRTRLRVGTEFATFVATGGDIHGQAHNHPINGQSIPSFGDVKWLRVCKQNIFPSNSVAYNIVVCANPASPNDTSTAIVYAVTVDSSNFTALSTQVDVMWNSTDLQGMTDSKKLDKLNDLYANKFADMQYDSAGMEKKFLELYQNFGLNLMRFNKTSQKWEKLVVENNTVTPKPCP